MAIQLDDYQLDAVSKLRNGSILVGGVGSGKSRTGIAFYFLQNGGGINPEEPMKIQPQDLYIITTAKKRDEHEWDLDLAHFGLSTDPNVCGYLCKVTVDSWNNIKKYADVKDAFFLFDEQRVVGYGAWTKSFLKIAKNNKWILLTATPGDTWSDYVPVFIANGFFKNKSDFERQHCYFNPYVKYKQIAGYTAQGRLIRFRNQILVDMDYRPNTIRHEEIVLCNYDRKTYRMVMQQRWNPFDNCPIENGSQFCQLLRRVVNSDPSRAAAVKELVRRHQRVIIFYSYNYEREILKNLDYGEDVMIAEWNGHTHEPVPDRTEEGGLINKPWVYLVQYFAGAEGWNCITTNAMIFYSLSYSYKTLEQAKGRIDRRNTPYHDLYYYTLKSQSSIDYAITKSIANKKDFNERRFYSSFNNSRKNLTL